MCLCVHINYHRLYLSIHDILLAHMRKKGGGGRIMPVSVRMLGLWEGVHGHEMNDKFINVYICII